MSTPFSEFILRFLPVIPVIAVIALLVFLSKKKEARAKELALLGEKVVADVTANPTDESVFALINYINSIAHRRSFNDPQMSNKYLKLWRIVSESAEVTADVKNQFRACLIAKGFLSDSDAEN